MQSFNQYAKSKPSYTALVITEADREKLLRMFKVPEEWESIAHHMTINMGAASNGPAHDLLGQDFSLKVISLAQDEKVMAVGVETEVPSSNQIKHITLGVNRVAGGKPFQSNMLQNWKPVPPLMLKGTVEEVVR